MENKIEKLKKHWNINPPVWLKRQKHWDGVVITPIHAEKPEDLVEN